MPEFAKHLISALGREYWINGMRVTSSISIGITHGSQGYSSAAELLRDADAAMYEAKAAGRACYVVFDSLLGQRIEKRARMERELRVAVEFAAAQPRLQPIIRLDSGRLVGLEIPVTLAASRTWLGWSGRFYSRSGGQRPYRPDW